MKKFVCACAAAAIVVGALASFSGCAKAPFNVRDYAVPIGNPEAMVPLADKEAYASAKFFENASSVTALGDGLFSITMTGGSRLYNSQTNAYVDDTLYASVDNDSPIIELSYMAKDGSGVTNYDYRSPTGELLIGGLASGATRGTKSGFLPNELTRTTLLTLSYNNGTDATRYFTYRAETYGGNAVLKEVDADDIRDERFPTHQAGSSLNTLVTDSMPVIDSLERRPYSLSGYTYAAVENLSGSYTYYSYRNGVRTGTFTVSANGALLTDVFMERYIYYYESTEVHPLAEDGYNVMSASGKYNITYYRYDMERGKTDRIGCDYYLPNADFIPLYNYTKGDFDAVYVKDAVPFVDGVAHIGNNAAAAVVLDAGLGTAYNVSDVGIDITRVVKIGENAYLAEEANPPDTSGIYYYLMNDRMETLAYFAADTLSSSSANSTVRVYPSLELIVGSIDNHYFGIGFDGKVIFENKFESLTFYGGAALDNPQNTGNAIFTKDHPEGTSVGEWIGAADDDTLAFYSGLIVRTPATGKISVYTYEGNKLADLGEGETVSSVINSAESTFATIGTNFGIWLLC